MKKTHLLASLLLILLASCQFHSRLGLTEEEINDTSLADLLKEEGLGSTEIKKRIEGDEESLIRHAAEQGWISVVHKLLLQGVDVDSKDKYGWPPLHQAAKFGHTEVARLLLEKGATVDSKDKNGSTPLHRAAYWGRTGVASLLLCHGADLTSTDKDGQTALQRASGETSAFLILAASKSKAWLEAYHKAFTWEKDKGWKKADSFAKGYAKAFSRAQTNDSKEWSAAYHREFWGKKQEGEKIKASHTYAKAYANAYVKAKTNENFQAAEKVNGGGDMYASYYAMFITQGKSHEAADGLAFVSATEF